MIHAITLRKAAGFLAAVAIAETANKVISSKGKKLHESVIDKGGYKKVSGDNLKAAFIYAQRTARDMRETGRHAMEGLADLADKGVP